MPADQLKTNPVFLNKIKDSVIKQFTEKVIDIWPDLTRKYIGADKCDGCVNSYIPINRTCKCSEEPYLYLPLLTLDDSSPSLHP